MSDFYEDFLVYGGQKYAIYFHASTNGFSEVYEYYLACDDVTRASLLFLCQRMGDIGCIYDETKFRIEDKQHKIYCFKPKKERFFCFFYIEKKIIITSAYTKKKQKLDQSELMKAIKIRKEYL